MADTRLKGPNTRWLIASKDAFANWKTPTAAELNAGAAAGVWNITCAVNQDGSTFDLGDSETDDSLTFCQVAGAVNPTTLNPDIVIEVETSKIKNVVNTANTAADHLRYPGVEYFFIVSVGKAPSAPFAIGDEIKLADAETDWGVPVVGTGENIRLSQTPLARGNVAWNVKLLS